MRYSKRTVQLIAVAIGGLAILAAAAAAAVDRTRDMRDTGIDAPEHEPSDPKREALRDLIDPSGSAAAICRGIRKGRDAVAGSYNPIMIAAATAATRSNTAALPPLWDGLGRYRIKVSTGKARAQAYFNQGLRFTYAFNHAEAVRSFRAAQSLDPNCAMCFWGEALALGPNINAAMEKAAVAPAVAAAGRAKKLAGAASKKEQTLIWALAKRYPADPRGRPAVRGKEYADAMREVARNFPDDDNVQALFAEALMNLQPWNYWEADGRTGRGNTDEIIEVLETVLARDPAHAAAIHLYIHMVEASETPERAKAYADRLAAEMPAAGHIVHMPSHIYYRLGLWREAMASNIAAVKADEAYLAQVDAKGIYPGGYFPHNIHFVVASAQMTGAGATALDYADKLARSVTPEAIKAFPWVQRILAAPYFAHVMFSEPDTILELAPPPEKLRLVRALWHYARAEARIAAGDLDAAEAEIAILNGFVHDVPRHLTNAEKIVAVARQVATGRLALHRDRFDAAINAFQDAARAQDNLPYREPPYWYYPVRQSLGAAFLKAGKPAEAIGAFRAALAQSPNNGWALFGLAEAYKAAGDRPAEAAARKLYERTWADPRFAPVIDRL